MDQFRQIGEALGSIKALMVFQDCIQLNQRQCYLLVDMLNSAYNNTAELMKHNLRYEDKSFKWKVIETPLRELLRVFKEGEMYVRYCLETKDFWAKAITLYQNTDCVELHIHNLLSCISVVIEAIEMAGEVSSLDHEEIQKKRAVYALKYLKECKDQRIFNWRYGTQYLVSPDFCNRIKSVWNEDRWILKNKIEEKKISSKQNQGLADLLMRNLNAPSDPLLLDRLMPCSVLVRSKDYHVRRRLEIDNQYKEVQWLGESFCLRHFFGDIEPLISDISHELTLSHPNIMHILCAFTDEEKKECFLIMDLMNKDLSSYIKEICGPKKRVPFSLPTAVDLMLQVARGMEYLHSMKIHHGNLNPFNVLVKARSTSTEGYLHAKVSGFGASHTRKMHVNQQNSPNYIWHAPEVLAEREEYSEKSDVYSFGMICFEVLTGKVPFEDGHLQGEKMSRNIRVGERPLFPFPLPKYLTSLTKKCWHDDPNQRPRFSSICRILRYIKRFIVLNPEHTHPDSPMPLLLDYGDTFFTNKKAQIPLYVTHIPFQMFVYKVAEREKSTTIQRENNSESESDNASACEDEIVIADEPPPSPIERKSLGSPNVLSKKLSISKKSLDIKSIKQPGTPRGRSVTPVMLPHMSRHGRPKRMGSESQLVVMSPRERRMSGHMSDSELP